MNEIVDIQKLYFDWMSSMAINDKNKMNSYSLLLKALHDIPFYYIIPLDENRLIDGINLKYKFANDYKIDYKIVTDILNKNNGNCSVLEMMIALALHCEDHIMYDPDIGDRLSNWFLIMLNNLKLSEMTNDNFDISLVNYRIHILLDRLYEYNGSGGLFELRYPKSDLRHVEIWYQMCWFLNELFEYD